MFNVVKVESVPLKSDEFSSIAGARCAVLYATRRSGVPIGTVVIGQADSMRFAAVPAIVAALLLLSSAPAPAATDEDQVRAVLDGMNGSYNRSDFTGFAAHLCTDILKNAGFKAGWYASRKSDGPTQITINSITVTEGPRPQAIANVRFQAANHADAKTFDVGFLRVDGDWKACRYDAGRYV
jgi:hypothetical protein